MILTEEQISKFKKYNPNLSKVYSCGDLTINESDLLDTIESQQQEIEHLETLDDANERWIELFKDKIEQRRKALEQAREALEEVWEYCYQETWTKVGEALKQIAEVEG